MGRRGRGSGLRPDSGAQTGTWGSWVWRQSGWSGDERANHQEGPRGGKGMPGPEEAVGQSPAQVPAALRPPGKEPAQAVEAGPSASVPPQHLWRQETKSHPRETRLVCVRRDACGLPPRSHDGGACQQAGVRNPLHRKSAWLRRPDVTTQQDPGIGRGVLKSPSCAREGASHQRPTPGASPRSTLSITPTEALASQGRASEDPRDGFWASDPHPTVPSQLQLTRPAPPPRLPARSGGAVGTG